jgi:hypothetical protein
MATALRFISEPELREEITAATNKVEAYNGVSAWLRFGHDAIERNDPAEHGAPSHVTQDELRAALTAGASQRPAGSQMPESASENTKASSARRRGRAAVDLPAFEATVLHDSTYRPGTPAL